MTRRSGRRGGLLLPLLAASCFGALAQSGGADSTAPAPPSGAAATTTTATAPTPTATTVPAPASPSATSASTATPTPDTTTEDRRRATILYGIDSELIELFTSLSTEKDSSYNADIKTVFERTKSPKLRAAVLGLWKDLAWKGGETAAVDVVKGRDNEDPKVVVAALDYLGEIKSKGALGYAKALLDENDRNIVPALISLLGKVGGPEEEGLLLDWLKNTDAQPANREAALRALGDMGSKKAVEQLVDLMADSGAPRFERIIAAESLGKIGDASALAPLVKAAQGDDSMLRASAVQALGSFKDPQADAALLDALRDSYPASRVAACKAIAKRGLAAALPNLEYKAENDPDKGVRSEALRSLGALGLRPAFAFLGKVLDDPKGTADMRQLAFGILVRKDAKASMGLLLARLRAEAASTDRSLYTGLSRELSGAADAPDAAPLAKVLLSDKDYLYRLGGLQWARATKSPDIKAEVAALASSDPNEAVKKLAAQVLALY